VPRPVSARTWLSATPVTSRSSATVCSASSRGTTGPGRTSRCAVAMATPQSTGEDPCPADPLALATSVTFPTLPELQ
jgi:hypothetical protein